MDCCCYNSSKISTKSFRTRYTFCTECVDSAILLPLTVINTNITMVISKNQLLLHDTLKHCNFWACFYSLSKLIILLNHDVFLICLLFRIFSRLNLIDLPLFLIHKVNVILFRKFLGLHWLSKLTIWLNHDVLLILLLFIIVSNLNHI